MTPTPTISQQPWMADPDLRAVFAALQAAGDPAPALLCVGGCVRDALMGRPVVDVDLATIHPPDVTLARLAAAGIDVLKIGIEHGTVVARFGQKMFQITTLRVDVETDGRHATVAYTDDWATDASRRDFTMNALYADLEGNVYDPLGGADDVAERRVRFIGDANARIEEDALRILRFFRFHAQIEEGQIDPAGLAACRARADHLAGLSGERIREELLKLLAAADPATTWQMLLDARILEAVLPMLTRRDRLGGLVTVEGVFGAADPLRRLAALVGVETGDAVAARIKLSNRDRDRLSGMIARGTDLDPEFPDRDRKARLYEIGPEAWRDAVLLNWAAELADGQTGARARAEAWRALAAFPATWSAPDLPIRGADVVAAGVPEGPEVSRLLKDVEDWWIEGGFEADRGACLKELARRADS